MITGMEIKNNSIIAGGISAGSAPCRARLKLSGSTGTGRGSRNISTCFFFKGEWTREDEE